MSAAFLKGDSAQTSAPATDSGIISSVKRFPFAEGTTDAHLQVSPGIFSPMFFVVFLIPGIAIILMYLSIFHLIY